ncbi:MAG: glutamate-5-semialdehyde dehydrogenase [Actinobacteria bacterium]|uniref:Gamma-glutamyl phosphate reductase n=1 Tax=Candidatus Fonsibacter lacus TaxID=2576439 RepID=A0A965LKZ5_9PROT|nr:glutamate-5-semialdehyde dehydrogenase [Candidatus Fonsibacter lacus]
MIKELSASARRAGQVLAHATRAKKDDAIEAIAVALLSREGEILVANNEDVTRSRSEGISESLIDRLTLTPARIAGIAGGARKIKDLPDPVGIVKRERTLPNGLHLKQVSVPFGIVGMVYEARPNVTVDAAVILLKSGNCALLRGSSSAAQSNEVLVRIMREAVASVGLPADIIQLVPSTDRSTVTELLHARGLVDLVIPRGSAALIRTVVDEAKVPTIETGAGVCHIFVDKDGDLAKALPILINSKVQRPSVCNAAETLLIDRAIAGAFLPMALKALHDEKVIIHGDAESVAVAKSLGVEAALATEENWSTEYGVLEINVRVVDGVNQAAEHIRKYGTNHTEAIVSENPKTIESFINQMDAAAIMINASTRFTDGEEMTTTTWIVTGTGQIRR